MVRCRQDRQNWLQMLVQNEFVQFGNIVLVMNIFQKNHRKTLTGVISETA